MKSFNKTGLIQLGSPGTEGGTFLPQCYDLTELYSQDRQDMVFSLSYSKITWAWFFFLSYPYASQSLLAYYKSTRLCGYSEYKDIQKTEQQLRL